MANTQRFPSLARCRCLSHRHDGVLSYVGQVSVRPKFGTEGELIWGKPELTPKLGFTDDCSANDTRQLGGMRASTEEFLYELWFIAESTLRPSWRYLGSSDFEAWAWRKGLHRRLADLAKQKLIEGTGLQRITSPRLVRLTAAGRCAALGGRDPEKEWEREWDGRWRMLLFDLPIDEPVLRRRLNRRLRELRFGFLQGSAWLSPHPLDRLRHWVGNFPIDPENFLLFEGRPVGGEADADLVAGAWDFVEINRRYERYLDVLRAAPKPGRTHAVPQTQIRNWLHRERAAWRHAIALDPLLPGSLLPKDYRGRIAWNAQQEEVPALISHLF